MSRLVLQVHPSLKDGPKARALENKSSFSAQLALPLLHPLPSLGRACPLPYVTHIYAVLARWSRGSLWSRRALWSYSLKGLGEREREEFIFVSEETYGLNQKAMAKPYSLTLNLHQPSIPQGPPTILGGLRGAQDLCKALWKTLLTECTLRAPSSFNWWLTLGIRAGRWAANGFSCIGNGSHCLQARFILGRGGNAKPMENRCQGLGIKN